MPKTIVLFIALFLSVGLASDALARPMDEAPGMGPNSQRRSGRGLAGKAFRQPSSSTETLRFFDDKAIGTVEAERSCIKEGMIAKRCVTRLHDSSRGIVCYAMERGDGSDGSFSCVRSN